MNFEGLTLIFRILLIAISFAGLCGIVNRRFRIDGTIAPFVSACGIIVLLMLGGMAGILPWVWRMLFAGGIAGAVYCLFGIIKNKSALKCNMGSLMPAIALGIAFVYALWRFNGVYFADSDTVSHWGMAGKYLLMHDKFPDASTDLIFFQSYPLGSACFIYYLSKGIGTEAPGAALCAQFMLNMIAFLPVLSGLRKNRIPGYILAAAAFAFLVVYNIRLDSLRVDTLQPFIALGTTASMVHYLNDKKRMFAIGALGAVCIFFIKSSGVFFGAVFLILALYGIGKEAGENKVRRMLKVGLLFAVILALAFAAWNLHVKAVYDEGLSTMHAVSVSNYEQQFTDKQGIGMIGQIGRNMLNRLLNPQREYVCLLLTGTALLLGCVAAICGNAEDRKKWIAALVKTVVSCVVLYAVWYVMLYLLYVFSMNAWEAESLVSIDRYEKTMQIYVMGIMLLFALNYFGSTDVLQRRHAAASYSIASIGIAGLLVVVLTGNVSVVSNLLSRQKVNNAHKCVFTLRDNYEIEEGKTYMVFSRGEMRAVYDAYYLIKYEFLSNDIFMIAGGSSNNGLDPKEYYAFQNTRSNYTEYDAIDNMNAIFSEYLDRHDYVLVLDKDPVFEEALNEFLETYEGDAQIMYAY